MPIDGAFQEEEYYYPVTEMMFVVIQLIISYKERGSSGWPPAREQA